jgi:hypothetical protein
MVITISSGCTSYYLTLFGRLRSESSLLLVGQGIAAARFGAERKKGRVVGLEGNGFAEVLFLRRRASADATDELGVLNERFDHVEGAFTAGTHLAEVVFVADVGGASRGQGVERPRRGDTDVLGVCKIRHCDHGLYIDGVVFNVCSALARGGGGRTLHRCSVSRVYGAYSSGIEDGQIFGQGMHKFF